VDAIDTMAKEMAYRIPADAILVPVPSRSGAATDTKVLAEKIKAIRGGNVTIEDVVTGNQRRSLYELKKLKLPIPEDLFGYSVKYIPQGNVYLVDNVYNTGKTAQAIQKLIPHAQVLVYAYSEPALASNKNWYKTAVSQEELLDIIDQLPKPPEVEKIPEYDNDFSDYDINRKYRKDNNPPAREEADVMRGFFEDYDSATREVLGEFRSLISRDPNAKQPWGVVPFARVKKIWEDYIKLGFVRDGKGIDQIAETMIRNVHRLAANTYLMGHTESSPDDTFEEYGITTDDQKDKFYDYASDDNGTIRISDYGLEPLQDEAIKLESSFDPTERLQIIDRMFNTVHQRSDLPALFIEGGSDSLNALAYGDEVVAKSDKWYKIAKLVDKEPNPDKSTYSACMFCKRWVIEDEGGEASWKRDDQLTPEESAAAAFAMTQMDNWDADIGVSHGICPYCKIALDDVGGFPRNNDDTRYVKEKSLAMG